MIEYSKNIILNTNLSLRRNIEGYDFPTNLSKEKSLEIVDAFRQIYKDELVLLEELDENSLNKYIEDFILSDDYDTREGQIAFVIKDDYIITINDKDHIAINVRGFNLDLKSAYKKAYMVESFLDSKFDFAFSPEYGYLTSDARNAGNGFEISYKLFLFGLVDSYETYMALKSTLIHEEVYFTRFSPRNYSKFFDGVFILKNFGNYREDIDAYMGKMEDVLDTLVRNERRFRRDFQALNKISDDDIFDQIEIIESSLKQGQLKSMENIIKALLSLKKYNNLGFRTNLSNGEIDYLIFNTTKNKYKGERDKDRYEFLNSYMEEREWKITD